MRPAEHAATHARPDADTAGLVLTFAIPDHPWVDSADGAAVRVAMTVAKRGSDPDFAQQNSGSDPLFAGSCTGRLLNVSNEQTGEFGEVSVTLAEKTGRVNADLSVGANVTSAVSLQANANLSSPGAGHAGAGIAGGRFLGV